MRRVLFTRRRVRNRAMVVLLLAIALALFLVWLPPPTRRALVTGLLAQRLVVGLLLFFSLLTLSLLLSAGQRLDARLFLYFNHHRLRSIWLDRSMWLATQLGGGLFGLVLAALFYFSGQRALGIELVLGILTLWLFVELVKAFTDRARPFILILETQIVGRRAIGKSFPSGHTSQAFFLATLLARSLPWGGWNILIFFGLAILVGITRLYVGAHYPRDVLAGTLLGIIWGIQITLIDPYLAGWI